MLDLDALADNRAKSLNQKSESWRKAIWSPPFQKLTQSMTDGEVESLIAACPSVGHLEWVVSYLDSQAGSEPPFSVVQGAAKKAGLTPEEWIRKCFASGQAL